MPTKKIADLDEEKPREWKPISNPCQHPDHNVPGMRVFEPGVYEHTCPACGNVKRFVVQRTHRL